MCCAWVAVQWVFWGLPICAATTNVVTLCVGVRTHYILIIFFSYLHLFVLLVILTPPMWCSMFLECFLEWSSRNFLSWVGITPISLRAHWGLLCMVVSCTTFSSCVQCSCGYWTKPVTLGIKPIFFYVVLCHHHHWLGWFTCHDPSEGVDPTKSSVWLQVDAQWQCTNCHRGKRLPRGGC